MRDWKAGSSGMPECPTVPHPSCSERTCPEFQLRQQVGEPDCYGEESRDVLSMDGFYVCPRDWKDQAQSHKCGGVGDSFCAAWGY